MFDPEKTENDVYNFFEKTLQKLQDAGYEPGFADVPVTDYVEYDKFNNLIKYSRHFLYEMPKEIIQHMTEVLVGIIHMDMLNELVKITGDVTSSLAISLINRDVIQMFTNEMMCVTRGEIINKPVAGILEMNVNDKIYLPTILTPVYICDKTEKLYVPAFVENFSTERTPEFAAELTKTSDGFALDLSLSIRGNPIDNIKELSNKLINLDVMENLKNSQSENIMADLMNMASKHAFSNLKTHGVANYITPGVVTSPIVNILADYRKVVEIENVFINSGMRFDYNGKKQYENLRQFFGDKTTKIVETCPDITNVDAFLKSIF